MKKERFSIEEDFRRAVEEVAAERFGITESGIGFDLVDRVWHRPKCSVGIGKSTVFLVSDLGSLLIYRSKPLDEIKSGEDLRQAIFSFLDSEVTSEEVIDKSPEALERKRKAYAERPADNLRAFDSFLKRV